MSMRFFVRLGAGLLLILVIALILWFIHQPRAYQGAPDSHDLELRVRKLGTAYIAKRPDGALVIGLWAHGRSIVQGFGQVSATNSARPDGETLFEIGSITKVFTGITLARLAENGIVKLNDPVSRYLPAGVACPEKSGRQITLEQLATHTAGLPRLPDNFDSVSADEQDPYASYHATELYQSLATVKLATEPGKKSEYSNYGFALLGHLLSLKMEKPYEQLIREMICIPLGLTNTASTLSVEQQRRLAPGHNPQGKIVPNWTFDVFAGAGALRSTADDLLKFVAVNLKPESSPLSAALLEAQKPHFKEFVGGVGLGWQIGESVEGPVIHWHNGGTGGYVSFIGFDKAAGVGVVVLSNYGDVWAGDNSIDKMGMQILKWESKISWD